MVLLLPPAIGAAYVGAFNAPTLDDRTLLWQVTIALMLFIPVGPLLILFGLELVTRPDPEALAKIDKIISELEFANVQASDLDRGLEPVRDVADHMRRRIEEGQRAPPQPPVPPSWRR
ncbi:MAG: hypothetical protein ACT6XY_01275 [Phreatobacter sp.]|uniref:hypothetical protein n=1 Tax=Phreatobacter sp. TaxID=1966341 RepID=UPI004036CC5D